MGPSLLFRTLMDPGVVPGAVVLGGTLAYATPAGVKVSVPG